MKKIRLLCAAIFASLIFLVVLPVNADESQESEEMVHCCRFDCAPMYCQRWPKACYYIDRAHCERWIEHGHGRIVSSCGDCEFPRRRP